MGSSSSSLADQHVVVVGGNFAGTGMVAEAEKRGARVTLIEPKDFLWVNFAAVRAAVDLPFARQTMVPLDRLFKNSASKHVRALATDVDAASKTVAFQPLGVDGKPSGAPATVRYDFLVLATGLSYSAPFHAGFTRAATKAGLAAFQDAVKGAQNVVIVGGGASGIELAGEVKEAHPAKAVSVVHGGSALLNSAAAGLSHAAFSERIAQELAAAGVAVHVGARVDLAAVAAAPGVTAQGTGVFVGSQTLSLGGGKTLPADLVVLATGGRANTAWLKASASLAPALDKAGFLAVELTYQVKGHASIFAIGDVAATKDSKAGYLVAGQAAVVAANMARLAAVKAGGPQPTLKQGKPEGQRGMALVPVGRKHGAVLLPFGIVRFPLKFKTKDYFTSMTAGKLGYKVPELQAVNA